MPRYDFLLLLLTTLGPLRRRLPSCPTALRLSTVGLLLSVVTTMPARAEFDLVLSISNPSIFSATELQILEEAVVAAELLWEEKITGYQPGITLTRLPISINGQTTGFADARVTSSVVQGGYNLAAAGRININRTILEEFSDFLVDDEVAAFPGQRVNVIDELIAHEVGHVLGFGTKWSIEQNGVRPYQNGSGQYVGQFGLAAYRVEFNQPDAQFVPVELAGSSGSANNHWDQLFRSQGEAGTGDPFELDPRLGIVDAQGRDFGLELMTAAIDPDWGEPFLSRTSVQALRDFGYTVVPTPTGHALAAVAAAMYGLLETGRRRRC